MSRSGTHSTGRSSPVRVSGWRQNGLRHDRLRPADHTRGDARNGEILLAQTTCLEGSPMEETRYGLKVSIPVPYDEAVVRATDALKAQGFGVLTTIDVK